MEKTDKQQNNTKPDNPKQTQSNINPEILKSPNISKNKNPHQKNNIDAECRGLWTQILKLNLPNVLIELQKRKLNTSGKLPELRSRLIRYIKGGYTESDFDRIIQPNNTNNKITMCERIPFANQTNSLVQSMKT